MKIKFDFVTNSSSTSFIVIFPSLIKTIEQVLKFIPEERKAQIVFEEAISQNPIELLPEGQTIQLSLLSYIKNLLQQNLDEFTTDEIVEKVKNKIENFQNIFLTQEEYILYHFCSIENLNEGELKEFLENKIGFIYEFSYADEEGPFWGEMEHGGTFNNLPYLAISHH